MVEFFTLTCPTCGARLQATQAIDRFVCAHCGNEHVIKKTGGLIFAEPIANEVAKAASELAIARLSKEIPVLESNREEKVKESQAREGYLLSGLPAEIEKAASERSRAGLWLICSAAALVVMIGVIVTMFGGPKSWFDWVAYMTCWGPITLVALVQVARVNSARRELNSLRRQLAQTTADWPGQKEKLDSEIDIIDRDLAQKKQELARHRQIVSAPSAGIPNP